jgi:protein-S-isoprenylcysteine O-methyltransferase Ste14
MSAVQKWFSSTPNRSFVLYPLVVLMFELALHRRLDIAWWATPLLAWGYLQYRFVGRFRRATGGGGPGLDVPPETIVDFGPYRYVRNPMYLGHLIFMLGLALTFRSWLALAILACNAVWFDRRVRGDEAHLAKIFGAAYIAYKARAARWIPFVY